MRGLESRDYENLDSRLPTDIPLPGQTTFLNYSTFLSRPVLLAYQIPCLIARKIDHIGPSILQRYIRSKVSLVRNSIFLSRRLPFSALESHAQLDGNLPLPIGDRPDGLVDLSQIGFTSRKMRGLFRSGSQ